MKRLPSLFLAGTLATLWFWAGVAFAGFSSPLFTPSPTTLIFGQRAVGTTSPPSTETYTVSGGSLGSAVEINSISISGDFAVAPGGTCQTGPANAVPTPGSCTVLVTFTPTVTGTRNGSLTVNCTSISIIGGGGIFCNQVTSSNLIVPLIGAGLVLSPVPALPASGIALLSGALLLGAFLTLKRRRA
jgi:hypothetical protein